MERAATSRISRTAAYATGGARERKASRNDSESACTLPNECSTGAKFTGTRSCGGAGANALDARKIEAQIAQ